MTRERPTTRRRESVARKLSKPRTHRKQDSYSELLEAAQASVGNFLRSTRESLRMTQAQVAERTRQSPWQLSRAAVSAIERGQNFPGLEAMLALSNVLHIDPKELIERARLTAVVPVDITGLSDEDLENRASQYFWGGDFKRALSVYDALVHKLALEAPEEAEEQLAARLATLEVRRSTTLKRVGALISAIASIERAISLSTRLPKIQTEAYVVLADLQAQRGHLPLARDAADRAIDLATEFHPERLAWACMVKGKAVYLAGEFDQAKQTFLRARQEAETHGDRQHLSHIAGDLGSCCQALGDVVEAQSWTEQAVELARERKQPALEASWLVELGKIRLERGDAKEADRLARAALEIAGPAEHRLTVFRAEWLRHRVMKLDSPAEEDASRVQRLEQLFRQLDQHEGIDEIVEFRDTILRATDEGG